MFSGLSVLGDTGFEFSWRSGNHKNSNIGLRGSGDHVFDEISMAGGIDNGEVVFLSLEFPERDINGDTSFSFGFQLV